MELFHPSALSALAMWFPGLFKDLAALFKKVEETGKWPDRILTAYTSLIPKDLSLQDPGPTDFRPITVLSGLYRLWGKARMPSLLKWQELWVTEEIFGCRRGRNAEQMMLQIAMDLESPAFSSHDYVTGVAHDFRKAFDLVPHQLMLTLSLQKRGCHHRITTALSAMYDGLWRAFKNGWLEYYFPIGKAYFQGLC